MEEIYTERNRYTLLAETPGQLDGKFHYLVELGTAEGTCKPLANPDNAIGTLVDQLQPGQPVSELDIRLLGKNGTMKMVQSGPIPKGVKVMADPAALGQIKAVPAVAGTYRAIGRKFSHNPGAAGDIVTVCDAIETVIVS